MSTVTTTVTEFTYDKAGLLIRETVTVTEDVARTFTPQNVNVAVSPSLDGKQIYDALLKYKREAGYPHLGLA
jgi:hypothetical protein